MKQILKRIISPQIIASVRILGKDIKRIIRNERKIQTCYSLRTFSDKFSDTFFGYYDISPFNSKDEVLYIEKEESEDIVRIVLNNIDDTNKRIVAKSKAWNWQQGSRLRWMPGSDSVLSFNDFDGVQYFNRIIDTETGNERRINWPLYDIDHTAKLGLSLNFERLGKLRPGYGYTCRAYFQDTNALADEGILIIDLEKNIVERKITYNDIKTKCNDNEELDNYYINHLAFSPSGQKFLFFWIHIIDGYHKASLIVYDIKMDRIIPLELEMKASHYVWQDDDTIICTSYDNQGDCRYYKYHISDRSKQEICPNSLRVDGHPSFYKTTDILLTDTYPDMLYFQHLYLVDIAEDVKKEILKIYSDPRVRGERRTDLHPRFNRDKSCIAFDANVTNHRHFYIISLK